MNPEQLALCGRTLNYGFVCPGRYRMLVLDGLVMTRCEFCRNVNELTRVIEEPANVEEPHHE